MKTNTYLLIKNGNNYLFEIVDYYYDNNDFLIYKDINYIIKNNGNTISEDYLLDKCFEFLKFNKIV